MLTSLLLLAQGYKEVIFNIPAPMGIYQPDFSSCSAKDSGIYQVTLPGYLYLTKHEFEVAIYNGSWTQKGNRLDLRTLIFMNRDLDVDESKPADFRTFMSGLQFEVLKNGNLRLNPPAGQVMKSKLTFRRMHPITVFAALKLASEINWDSKEVQGAHLNWPYFMMLSEFGRNYEGTLLDILKSGESLKIRNEAARNLEHTHTEAVIRYAGDTYLKLQSSKVREEQMYRRRLLNIVIECERPMAFDYATQAYEKKLVNRTTAVQIASRSHHPKAAEFVTKMADEAKPTELANIIEYSRNIDKPTAVLLAKKYESNEDPEVHFQVLRNYAECAMSADVRDKSVQQLADLFAKAEWMQQCDIAKSLGIAQTPLALSCLKKMSGHGSERAVQRWIDEAIGKYAKK